MNVLLYTHIITGMLGLISGSAALFQKKGGKSHKLLGKVFFWSMLASSISALVLAGLKNNHFLLLIGIFTIYMALAGRNFLLMHRWKPARKAGIALTGVMTLVAVVILVLGIRCSIEKRAVGAILIGFAVISGFLLAQDVKYFRTGEPGTLTMHIGRMVGAWIASWSAFLVVNQFIPWPMGNWILPTVAGVPLIVYWIRKMERAQSNPNSSRKT